MKKALLITMILLINYLPVQAQQGSKVKSIVIDNKVIIDMRSSQEKINGEIERKLLPKPHPGTDRKKVREIKEQFEKFRSDNNSPTNNRMSIADSVTMLRNFFGNNFNGFVPNDNDVAVSNNDVVASVTNTTIWSRDMVNNVSYGTFTLHTLTTSLGLQQEEFDPKIMYDPLSNRFVMVCLNGFTDSTSNILLGFSQDSTSYGNWNFYSLPGDPLNNNLWTDFPMIALTQDEVIITANLLYNDSTWQAGFNETVIWQINKSEGYSGVPLNSLLHFNIHHNNEPLRNICPVKGGSTLHGPNIYFVSNRNFTAGNDTIFLMELSGAISNPPPTISVTPIISNIEYRLPLDAVQPYPDLLIVNDARILGAFHENNKIQFVFNMLDTVSGKTAIYHGIVDLISNPPLLNGNIYANDTLYLAYPNISWAGINSADNTAIISVLLSSSSFQPGTAAFQYDGIGDYSPLTIVRKGISYTNMLVGNERWGDYTGCQTRYNMPGYVWVSGSYSIANHTTRTWIAELTVNTGVSLNEIASGDEEMNIFPNPTEDRFTVKFDNPTAGMIFVEAYDTGGKLISVLYRGSLAKGQNSFSFNASALSAGSYIIKISDSKRNMLSSKKLIRN